MSGIALYEALKKIDGVSDAEAKEAIADIANSKDVATKADLKEGLAELKAGIEVLKADVKWMLGLLMAVNAALIVSTVSLLVKVV